MGEDNKTPAATQPKEKRVAPKLELTGERNLNATVKDEDQLSALYGTRTKEAAENILQTSLNALGSKGIKYMDLVPAMAVEMEPQDAVEAMLIGQMAATHVALTLVSQKMADVEYSELREAYERSTTRLSRTFLAQVEALKKYRAKAQQTVRVERVEVNEGGQAVVGDVSYRRGDDGEK